MDEPTPEADDLVRLARAGDHTARGHLLMRHRERLLRMVTARLDPRLAARVGASDVVQETLAEADRRLDEYLQAPPLPFYPWLRQLAWDRLVHQHRLHVRAACRTVAREQVEGPGLSNESALALVERVVRSPAGPSAVLIRQELVAKARIALDTMTEEDREVLALRYLEAMSAGDVAAVLRITEAAARKRALRALQRLRGLLGAGSTGGDR